jgi:C4-dicarboxylate-binding protein DctP
LADNGMKVHVQTSEEAAAWKALMVPAFDKSFGNATGEDGLKLIELVNQISN